MAKSLFIYSIFALCLLSCGRPNKVYNPQGIETRSETQRLKQQIDSAVMKTYWDADYHVEVSYPDFFVLCDTAEEGTARFYYPSKQEQRIALIMFVEPNVEGWNVHEAINHLSDSNNVCQEEGEDYYIMSGQLDQDPRARFFEKCYLINGMWINYTVYYPIEDEDAIGRLIDMVKEWSPRKPMAENRKEIVEMDSSKIAISTFGVEFTSDPRLGFKNCSVKIPKYKGLYTSQRWAYCKKDSCNTGYYAVGIRCPQNVVLRRWANNKLWYQI